VGALRLFFGGFIASATKMNLHGIPIEPVAVLIGKNHATLKALELISTWLSGNGSSSGVHLWETKLSLRRIFKFFGDG
jgi:hypothetical protein